MGISAICLPLDACFGVSRTKEGGSRDSWSWYEQARQCGRPRSHYFLSLDSARKRGVIGMYEKHQRWVTRKGGIRGQ